MSENRDNPKYLLQNQLPVQFKSINQFTIQAMLWLNGCAHVVIGFALAVSILMITLLFFSSIYDAAHANNLVHGFLHALGTLMLLWSISSLISAEIRYLRGHKLMVETFVEVVLIMFLRKLIVIPVQDTSMNYIELAIWLCGAIVLCIVYVMVRIADRRT